MHSQSTTEKLVVSAAVWRSASGAGWRARNRCVSHRPAITLIELMIVVTILLVLLGIAVPLSKPVLDQGKVREGARQVSAFLQMAKARAVELGRPAGVWIERRTVGPIDLVDLSGDPTALPNTGTDLFLAEMPPTYSGDILGATVRLNQVAPGKWVADQREAWQFVGSEFMHGMLNPNNEMVVSGALIRPGEFFSVRFDFKGPQYRMQRGIADNPFNPELSHPALFGLVDKLGRFGFDPTGPAEPPSPPPGARFTGLPGNIGLPFQIFRAPVKTSGRTLQLSGDTVIDLENSGLGARGYQFQTRAGDDISPVVIMFYPGGGVERVVSQFGLPVTGSIHLLVGTSSGIERAGNTPETPNPLPEYQGTDAPVWRYNQNLTNPDSVWVSIGHRTGVILSSENGWFVPTDRPFYQDSLAKAREFAQQAQVLGGQ